jgi:hypothetical protein
MQALLTTVRRVLAAPALLPLTAAAAGASWLGVRLAQQGLGGSEGFVDEVRAGCLPFAGALVVSLAEPIAVAGEARSGLVLLRLARGAGPALAWRCAGLVLAALPTVLACALATGGWPADPFGVLLQLVVLAAAGLLLGAWLARPLCVPALWCLLVAGHLRPWFGEAPLAWLLPALGGPDGAAGALHALLWTAGALVLADARLRAVAAGAG